MSHFRNDQWHKHDFLGVSKHLPSAYTTDYIGLKMRNDGNVVPISGTPTTYKYWVASEQLNNSSPVSSIALSTKNDNNNGLFMAYVRYKDFPIISTNYCIAYKTSPWNFQSFKPGNNQKNNDSEDNLVSISILPNPFNSFFTIHSNLSNNEDEYTLNLNTILGKQILNLKGTIAHLNSELQKSALSNQPSGIYLLTIKDSNNKIYQFKLIKN